MDELTAELRALRELVLDNQLDRMHEDVASVQQQQQ